MALAQVAGAPIRPKVLHRILTPELVGDEVIYAAFEALAPRG